VSRRSRSDALDVWIVLAGAVALLVLAPIAALAPIAGRGSVELWGHLFQYVLPDALRDTAILLAGVGLLAGAIGASAAWAVSAYDFPGRRTLDWALLLPLAMPTYIVAYAYLDLLHPVGPVQTGLRWVLGYDSPRDLRLPDIRSMVGCIVLLSSVLYPYVYLTARALFAAQGASCFDAARTLGTKRGALFWRVALPLARPAIVVGVSLALLETLNDIGASEFLGVRTLTVSLYATWVTRSDLAGAAQMALAMLALVIAIVAIEWRARGARRFDNDARQQRPLVRAPLHGWRAAAVPLSTAMPVVVGFLLPAGYLVDAAVDRLAFAPLSPALASETVTTLTIAALATVITTVLGVVVAYASHGRGRVVSGVLTRATSLGYAVPGTVLAIGLLPVLTSIDSGVERVGAMAGMTWTLFTLGTGAGVVYACVARFLAISVGTVDAGLSRVSPSTNDAARTLGASAGRRLWRIYLPLTRPAVLTAAMLVFVDCMKELPATLLLRPIGVETLATHLYGDAVRGTYEDGALAALLIVAAGLIPVAVLARISRQGTIITRSR
jgi:iron(III) transport system permease protein